MMIQELVGEPGVETFHEFGVLVKFLMLEQREARGAVARLLRRAPIFRTVVIRGSPSLTIGLLQSGA
jgi:hypothetical protein